MRCPVCKTENEEGTHNCIKCGSKLNRRKAQRRNAAQDDNESKTNYRLAWAAYRCSLFGLVPFAGLLLGPLALGLGFVAWRRDRIDPWVKGIGPAVAAIILGLLITLTNWAGLALMLHGRLPWKSD